MSLRAAPRLALILLGLLLVAGCPGERPKEQRDGAGAFPDLASQLPDSQRRDTAPPKDSKSPPKGDGYAGAPFGCVDEQDCFGQRCCPTPWGVKLCAPTCGY